MSAYLQLSIADGFGDDCDELIHRCLQETPVTYSAFCKVFRSMQMSCVFLNRQSEAEIAELTEELILIAKYYMVANTSNFESTVVGLFLVYALVKLQPFEDFAYLRVSEEDVQYIERIEFVARRDRRLDVLYVLGRVLTENTRYTAVTRERGMEPSYRKYLENCSTLETTGQRPKGVFLRQNEELDMIKELNDLQLRYDAAKEAANVGDLNYVESNFAKDLNTSLNNIVSGFIDNNKDEIDIDTQVQETVKTIKEKAMKNKVDPMRHLVGVADRYPKIAHTPHVSDIKTKAGKIKTSISRTKMISDMRKQTLAPNERKARKRKKPDHSSDTAESDLSMESSDHDSDNDILLENTIVQPTSEVRKTSIEELPELEVDGTNLQLEGLPCIITSDDNGQSYEIEIIDRCNESIKNPFETSVVKPEYRVALDNEIRIRKERRDLKKTILKSRFKRMGIDPAFKAT